VLTPVRRAKNGPVKWENALLKYTFISSINERMFCVTMQGGVDVAVYAVVINTERNISKLAREVPSSHQIVIQSPCPSP
jgi:hypothetical protein